MTHAFAPRIACLLLLALGSTACATRGDPPVRHTADGRICPQSFDFVLADMPGLSAFPLSFTPWMIFRGDAPEGLAVYGPGKVLALWNNFGDDRAFETQRAAEIRHAMGRNLAAEE